MESESVYASGEPAGTAENESWKIIAAIICACCSAIAAGLTLGLMTFDNIQLKILIQSGESADPQDHAARQTAKYAKRVYKVRKRGNLLLVTLLVVNVSVNSAFSILMGDTTSGVVGFLISTVVLTLFGEILPQAICVRYGLPVGYFFVPLVILVEAILSPICWPLAKCLDWALGEEIGKVYNKNQLEVLLEHHVHEAKLLREEMDIMGGGMHLGMQSAADAMTPISDIYSLDAASNLDFDTFMSLFSTGFSRIPIVDMSKPQCVVGVVHVKDLLLIDPSANIPIKSINALLGRPVYAVDAGTSLMRILNDFKKGHTHLAVVRSVEDEYDVDPFFKHVGIITLEDIIEEILQDEIHDEFERLPDGGCVVCPRRISGTGSLGGSLARSELLLPPPPAHGKGNNLLTANEAFRQPRSHMLTSGARLEPSNSGIFVEDLNVLAPRRRKSHDKDGEGGALTDQQGLTAAEKRKLATKHRTRGRASKLREFLLEGHPHKLSSAEVAPPLGTSPSTASPHRLNCRSGSTRHLLATKSSNSTESSLGADPLIISRSGSDRPIGLPLDKQDLARMGRLNLARVGREAAPLGNPEVMAVCLYLSAVMPSQFSSDLVDSDMLASLCSKIKVEMLPAATQIYKFGVVSNKMTLVTQGKVKALIGTEQLESLLGPWSILGAPALGDASGLDLTTFKAALANGENREDVKSRLDFALFGGHEYRPDYNASVLDHEARILSFTKQQYLELLLGSLSPLVPAAAAVRTAAGRSPPAATAAFQEVSNSILEELN